MDETSFEERQLNKVRELRAENPRRQTTILYNWTKFHSGAGCIRLQGNVSGHPRLPDGYVTTTCIRYFNEECGVALSANTLYILRRKAC